MLVHLKEMVEEAAAKPCAVPAFNVFGYEDAAMVVRAAEEANAPVILAANIPALQHMPYPILGGILVRIAEGARVPVCVHLDHGKDYESAVRAIDAGFTSVMFDGSQLPFADNVDQTRRIVEMAHARGISVEAEIGSVGYSDPAMTNKHELSNPDEVEAFVAQTGIDAVAVSIGTVHRMETQGARLDFGLLETIQSRVGVPLVIHGSTGVADGDLRRLATCRVGKINIGTAIRMAFGKALRAEMAEKPHEFDRIKLFQKPMEAVKAAALNKFQLLGYRR